MAKILITPDAPLGEHSLRLALAAVASPSCFGPSSSDNFHRH
ncbi:MAG: hypothetical protein QM755_18265 [Luteolibacter sp.]